MTADLTQDALIPAALRQAAIGDGSFPAGTPIAVPSSDGAPTEMAVEGLARGDLVLTLGGKVAVRHVAARRTEVAPVGPDLPPRPRVMPVRVAAGAFGEGQPVADLLLPPEQLVHVLDGALPGGALVPLGALVNGSTIRREPQAGPIDWVRLELEQPGVVIAAGLLVAARLDPAFPPPAAIVPAGPAMFALRDRLARAGAPAAVVPAAVVPAAVVPAAMVMDAPIDAAAAEVVVTDEEEVAEAVVAEEAVVDDAANSAAQPAAAGTGAERPPGELPMVLRVLLQGRPLELLDGSTALTWHYMLPEGAMLVRLVSPRGLPANTPVKERATARRFGVAVRAILLDDAPLVLDGPAIGDGFHTVESAGTASWRWTNGEAVVHLPPSGARRRLTVEITDWHRMLQPE